MLVTNINIFAETTQGTLPPNCFNPATDYRTYIPPIAQFCVSTSDLQKYVMPYNGDWREGLTPENTNSVLELTKGTKIKIQNLSVPGSGTQLMYSDLQTYINGAKYSDQGMFQLYNPSEWAWGGVKEFTLDQAGTWDIYMSVSDNEETSNGWENQNVNGEWRYVGYSEKNKIWFCWYFVHCRIIVKDITNGTPEENQEPDYVYPALQINNDSWVDQNKKDYENNVSVPLSVTLDASASSATKGIDHYEFTLNGSKIISTEPIVTKTIYVKRSLENAFGLIQLDGEVVVYSKGGNLSYSTAIGYTCINPLSHPPQARFTYMTPVYANSQMTLTNTSTDAGNDVTKAEWTVCDWMGTELANSTDGIIDSSYIDSIDLNNNGGIVTFKISDVYILKLKVTDSNDDFSSTQKYISVDEPPRPPVASFSLPASQYTNTSTYINDQSTDPDNDIVSRVWTISDSNHTGTMGSTYGYITWNVPGTYAVTLTVRDSTGLTDATTKYIEIKSPVPKAIISYSGTLKENRKVSVNSYSSTYPFADPIKHNKDEWNVLPLDGQDLSVVKMDVGTAGSKDILFKQPGQYKITLKVHNNYSDANPFDFNVIINTYAEQIITIAPDQVPNASITVTGETPTFQTNPTSSTVTLNDLSASVDQDFIAKRHWVIWKDTNDDGDFSDEAVFATADDFSNLNLDVPFATNSKGNFKAELTTTEEFGQPTIDKFVTSADRRSNSITQYFQINWVPDITFNLSAWDYTDDTLSITTAMSDERVSACTVSWSLTKANQHNAAQMDMVNINTEAISGLGKTGGTIRFSSSGYYTLTATIVDEVGQSYSYSKSIRVYPLPNAVINDDSSLRWQGTQWQTKENRKYRIYGSVNVDDEYGAGSPIDHSKDYWEIIPLDGQEIGVIKIQNGSGGLLLTSTPSDTLKFVRQEDKFDEMLLFKKAGRYKIRYQATNVDDKKTPFAEQIITVAEDTAPTINFEVQPTSYRNNLDGNRATCISYSIKSSTNDDDILINQIRYRFDSNNDGNFEDETWSAPVLIDQTNLENWIAIFKVNYVGKYQVELLVQESFGQPTIPEFVNDTDCRKASQYKTIEVINIPATTTVTTDTDYVLLNEPVNYYTSYSDYESDPQYGSESRWKYDQDSMYFDNTQGIASFNGQWLSNSVNSFDKVGKYTVKWETRDNPVGSDERFAEYRLWSESNEHIIYVHRKPIAQFQPTITKNGSTFTIVYNDTSYDLDHQTRADKGIVNRKWQWKKVTDVVWNDGQLTKGDTTTDYEVKLQVQDMDGIDGQGAWSDEYIVPISTNSQPPTAQFTLAPHTFTIEESITDLHDSSFDPDGDPIEEWRWTLTKTFGENQGTWSYNFINAMNISTLKDSINAVIQANGAGNYKLELRVRDTTGVWGDLKATSTVYTDTFIVTPVNHAPTADFTINPNPQLVEAPVEWTSIDNDPDADNEGFDHFWTLERFAVPNVNDITGAPTDIYNYISPTPFTGSFKGNNLPWGAYRITERVYDRPPVPPFTSNSKKYTEVVKTFYAVPELILWANCDKSTVSGGEEVALTARTNMVATDVTCNIAGDLVALNYLGTDGLYKYWSFAYTIPVSAADGEINLLFTTVTDYGGNGLVTRTTTQTVTLNVTSLLLDNYRITDMVNHPWYTFPLFRDKNELPVDYKTGYYVTFETDAKGNPDSVEAIVSLDGAIDQTVEMWKVSESGSDSIWEGKYYAHARTPVGTVVTMDLTAYKDNEKYNYNIKTAWDGRVLIVEGTALQDARVNRID